MLNLQEIARIMGGEVSGNQVRVPGPGHSSKDRSLSIKIEASAPGGFLTHSFAGDEPIHCKDYVREKLGLPAWSTTRGRSVVWTYDYTNEAGELLFQVVRCFPKNFRQRHPDAKGGFVWSMKGARRVPYRLPEILKAVASKRTIFIAEGEKAVDALVKLGVSATCSPGGAGKWLDEYSQHLANADVMIVPDNDEHGEGHCKAVAESLAGVSAKVRVLRLPGLPPKGDAFDWVQAGGTAEQLGQLVEMCSYDDATRADCPTGSTLISRRASEIEPERVEWLWHGRIAMGKHTCIAGEPGTGKSQLTLAIAAAISTGGEWPCGEGRAPLGSVIILSAEDGERDTIVPRLMAAGADRDRVHIVSAVRPNNGSSRGFSLQADLGLLEDEITKIGDATLVIIDPISSYLGKADSHKNAEVRGVLEPIGEMAQRMRVAVCSITHFSKPNGGKATKALHKFIGSIAFVAAARAAFAVLEDPNDKDRRLFLHAKNNLAEPPPGLAFRLEQVILGEGIVSSCVEWEPEPVTTTADEALAGDGKSSLALIEAECFLEVLLANGPVASKQVDAEAQEAGVARATLRRAKASLGIKPYKDGMKRGWFCALPNALNANEGAHLKDMSTFEMDEHLRDG